MGRAVGCEGEWAFCGSDPVDHMNTNAIREALHQQPFVPFALRLVDGRELKVRHPDFVAVSPGRVIVINPDDEATSLLEPLLIVSIGYPRSSPNPSGNGADGGNS